MENLQWRWNKIFKRSLADWFKSKNLKHFKPLLYVKNFKFLKNRVDLKIKTETFLTFLKINVEII